MNAPPLQGVVRRRVLLNFRVAPDVIQRQLPPPFRPDLVHGWAVAGVCLIRLERLRPSGLPAAVGLASENAAHRVAVTWTDPDSRVRRGVYIPRRDTGSLLNHLVGGRLFPGSHGLARFVVHEDTGSLDLTLASADGAADVRLRAHPSDSLPTSSVFCSLDAASAFFAGGSLGYSPARGGRRLDGLELRTSAWRVEPLVVESVYAGFFSDSARFPPGSVAFDSALLMRDIPHSWRPVPAPTC